MSIAPLRHTPIRRKLLTLALAAGLAFFTVSALFILSWRDLEKVTSRVSSTYIPTLRDGSTAMVNISSLGTELFRYVNQFEPSDYRINDALQGARGALQRISQSDIPAGIRANIESLLPLIAAHEAGLRQLTTHVESDDVLGTGEVHTRMSAEAGLMLQGAERINGQLWDSIVQENRAGARESLERAAVAAGLSLLCILAALLYMTMVRRDLETGLAGLREAARKYASGESGSIAPLDRRDEIGQLSSYLDQTERELAASREAAMQAARAKAAFLAAMSHEIRTPLNGVLGMAGLLADTALTEEQHEYVDTIRVSGDALLSVINDILDYSKIESGRMEVEVAPFEPMRAVEEALEILGERARGKRLELAADAEDSVPAWVLGDFARLRQVLVNLVGNAVKFTERGEVVVRLRAPSAETLEIEVSDTGVGIPMDRLSGLFQAFTQADASTTRKYGGTGLGLAISKRLVELMGGELRAVSEPGRGSTFGFSVSVRSCAAPPTAAVAAQTVQLTARRILIVDDNATNLRILRRQLERWGAVPVAASNGPAALALLAGKERFDAALLDYHMPEMDGVMLARRIKALAGSLPLVLLSSSMYRRAEEAEAGLFVIQLLKPVRQQQLREVLVTALGGAAPERKGVARAAAGTAVKTQLRVLVADDVDANCRLARALLRRFGHLSEVATSGLEAVELATAGGYDVVLMDVEMPDIDGLEATRRIRERLGAATPRIIAVTANAMPGDRERCLAAGMDDYLSKPIEQHALRAAIEQAGSGAVPGAMRAAGVAPAPAGAIDWSRIESLKPFDSDGSMVAGAIASFFNDAPGRIEAIRATHAAGDAAGLASASHALKGAAANIGAARLQELSGAIETCAREGRLEGAGEPIGGLAKALAEAREALAARRGVV